MDNPFSIFHSVILDEDSCKGCTICVTGCPVEAIRVRNGKARILEERCIDCGECIRRCPNRAKKADTAPLASMEGYDCKIAVVAPSFYGQFPAGYSVENILQALGGIGFDYVFEAALGAEIVTRETLKILKKEGIRPLISSSCPAVLRLIQVRFPTLLEHIIPLLSPMEIVAGISRKMVTEILKKTEPPDDSGKKEGQEPVIGVFFISPCPAKVTAVKNPLGHKKSQVDQVISMNDLYLPLLTRLKKSCITEEEKQAGKINRDENKSCFPLGSMASAYGIMWASREGECRSLEHLFTREKNSVNEDSPVVKEKNTGKEEKLPGKDSNLSWISVDGINEITSLFESIEDGNLQDVDFVEAEACPSGCSGGPLTIVQSAIAKENLRQRFAQASRIPSDESVPVELKKDVPVCSEEKIHPRPILQLDKDFSKACKMMKEIEEILPELPGLDCGSCGAPNCRALAEDIVKRKASKEDCVFVLKKKYFDGKISPV